MGPKTIELASLQMLTGNQIAILLNVSKSTAYTWMRQRKLPVIELPNGKLRVRATDLDTWQQKNSIPAE